MVDRQAAERAVGDFLRAMGRPPESDPELTATPARVAEAFAQDLLAGYSVDRAELVAGGSAPIEAGTSQGIVVVAGITLTTVCPHHLLPSIGQATVAYRPGTRLLGPGTIAALVDACARRLVLQEQIGQDVVTSLVELAGARGAFCRISLSHGCLSARGARQAQARVHTTAAAGELARPESAAELALALGAESGPP
jgi:GTP cyclohydrolase IA